MIVRFFKTGQSHGEAPVNYLLRMRDHAGELRAEQPEVLEGSPRLTIDLINGIARKHKFASGCLAFRGAEQPSKAELHTIIDQFKAVVAPGLAPDQFNSLFVLHREPPDPKTGQSGFHVHFVMPMTILGGTTADGKDMTGRRWNPHPPGKKTIETMALFTKMVNHEHGWSQVVEKPGRVSVDSFWLKAGNTSNAERAELLRKELNKGIRSGQINSRDELCSYMDQLLGLTITRTGTDYVSVKFPSAAKAVRLQGAMFESATDYAALRAAMAQKQGGEVLSVSQYAHTTERLDTLLSERAHNLSGHRPANQPITITKEKKNGRNEKGPTQLDRRGAQPSGGHSISVTAHSLERDMFQAGAGKWGHADDGGSAQGAHRPQKIDVPSQHSGHASHSLAGGQWRQLGRSPLPSYGQTINEQIRELGMQLLESEPWSAQAAAIMAQINALVGQREQLPKGPRIGRG